MFRMGFKACLIRRTLEEMLIKRRYKCPVVNNRPVQFLIGRPGEKFSQHLSFDDIVAGAESRAGSVCAHGEFMGSKVIRSRGPLRFVEGPAHNVLFGSLHESGRWIHRLPSAAAWIRNTSGGAGETAPIL